MLHDEVKTRLKTSSILTLVWCILENLEQKDNNYVLDHQVSKSFHVFPDSCPTVCAHTQLRATNTRRRCDWRTTDVTWPTSDKNHSGDRMPLGDMSIFYGIRKMLGTKKRSKKQKKEKNHGVFHETWYDLYTTQHPICV